eukprot:12910368-Prorocentrum_lima.AAC.1
MAAELTNNRLAMNAFITAEPTNDRLAMNSFMPELANCNTEPANGRLAMQCLQTGAWRCRACERPPGHA